MAAPYPSSQARPPGPVRHVAKRRTILLSTSVTTFTPSQSGGRPQNVEESEEWSGLGWGKVLEGTSRDKEGRRGSEEAMKSTKQKARPHNQAGPSKPTKKRKSTAREGYLDDDIESEVRDISKIAKRVCAAPITIVSDEEADAAELVEIGDDSDGEAAVYPRRSGGGSRVEREKQAKALARGESAALTSLKLAGADVLLYTLPKDLLRIQRSRKSHTPDRRKPPTTKLTLSLIPPKPNLLRRPSPSPESSQEIVTPKEGNKVGSGARNGKGREKGVVRRQTMNSTAAEDISKMFDDDIRPASPEFDDIAHDVFADDDLLAIEMDAIRPPPKVIPREKPVQPPVAIKAPTAKRSFDKLEMPEAWKDLDKDPANFQGAHDGPEMPEDLIMKEAEEEYYEEIFATQGVPTAGNMPNSDGESDGEDAGRERRYSSPPNPILAARLQAPDGSGGDSHGTHPPSHGSSRLSWSASPATQRRAKSPMDCKGKGREPEERRRSDLYRSEKDLVEEASSDEDVPLMRQFKGKQKMVEPEEDDNGDGDSDGNEDGQDVVDLTIDEDDDPIESRNVIIERDCFDDAQDDEDYGDDDGFYSQALLFEASQPASPPPQGGSSKPQQFYAAGPPISKPVHNISVEDIINPLQPLSELDSKTQDFFLNHFRRRTARTKTREDVAQEAEANIEEQKSQAARKQFAKRSGRGGGGRGGAAGGGYRGGWRGKFGRGAKR